MEKGSEPPRLYPSLGAGGEETPKDHIDELLGRAGLSSRRDYATAFRANGFDSAASLARVSPEALTAMGVTALADVHALLVAAAELHSTSGAQAYAGGLTTTTTTTTVIVPSDLAQHAVRAEVVPAVIVTPVAARPAPAPHVPYAVAVVAPGYREGRGAREAPRPGEWGEPAHRYRYGCCDRGPMSLEYTRSTVSILAVWTFTFNFIACFLVFLTYWASFAFISCFAAVTAATGLWASYVDSYSVSRVREAIMFRSRVLIASSMLTYLGAAVSLAQGLIPSPLAQLLSFTYYFSFVNFLFLSLSASFALDLALKARRLAEHPQLTRSTP